MEQNPSTAQATNLATKSEQLRQINPLKEAKLITSLKQAENFADKKSVLAPNQPSAICEKYLTQQTRQKDMPTDKKTLPKMIRLQNRFSRTQTGVKRPHKRARSGQENKRMVEATMTGRLVRCRFKAN